MTPPHRLDRRAFLGMLVAGPAAALMPRRPAMTTVVVNLGQPWATLSPEWTSSAFLKAGDVFTIELDYAVPGADRTVYVARDVVTAAIE